MSSNRSLSEVTCACVINLALILPLLYPDAECLATGVLEAYISVISIFKIVAQGFLLECKVERSQIHPSKLPVIQLNIQLIMADLVETTIGAQREERLILLRFTCRRNIKLLKQEFNSKANTRSKV